MFYSNIRILSLLLAFISFHTYAQEGSYFLTHYTSSYADNIDNVNFDFAQDQKGIVYMANRSGILQFDGKNWDFFKTPAAIFTLVVDENNTLYAGGIDGFGMMKKEVDKKPTFVSLTDSLPHAQDIFSMIIHKKKLYAINHDHIFIHDPSTKRTEILTPQYSGTLENLFLVNGTLWVQTEKSGMQTLKDGKLANPPGIPDGIMLTFISGNADASTYITGTPDALFSYKNEKLLPLKITNDNNYLSSSEIINILWVNDSLIAATTLTHGMIFINPVKGEIQEIVNYQNGLPDNQIYAASLDHDGGIWVAHALGFTRIMPIFPFKSYNRYTGLQGEILCAKNHKGRLYVGTSLGAYYLKKIERYTQAPDIIKQVTVNTPASIKEEDKKNGLFGFMKGKSKKQPTSRMPIQQKRVKIIKRIGQKELQSVQYVYEKIPGIDSKTTQLTTAEDRLFCGGLDGLFEIQDTSAFKITNVPVHYFYASETYGNIFVSTYDDHLKVYDYHKNDYPVIDVFGDFTDYVPYIFEDHKARIWFCGTKTLYWVTLTGKEIVEMDEYQIENPYYYETYGKSVDGKVLFVNEAGTYRFDEENNHIAGIQRNSSEKYLKSSDGEVWLYNNHQWHPLGSDALSSELKLLSIFKNITFISTDSEEDSYWIITSENELYHLSHGMDSPLVGNFGLFLKNIKTTSKIILPTKKQLLRFDQENSGLVFEFVQPDYSGIVDKEYQYKLEGLYENWSEWSSTYDVINFPYLPDGKYKLYARSRDLLGNISEAEAVSFEVVPPYWKRPWFYAFEFSAMAVLLMISVNIKKLGYKYRLMSRLLALITLIIIIEFIQTIGENELASFSSPVLDFIMQVVVAIIILPVESILRKYIFKEKGVQVFEFMSLKNKEKNGKYKLTEKQSE